MKDSKALPWIAGSAILAILVLAFAWLVVISPTRSGASEDRAAAQQQQNENDLLAIQNRKLASDFAKLADYKATLAEAQQQMPASIDQPTFSRELDRLATSAGVTITNITFSPSLNLLESAAPASAPTAKPGDPAAELAPTSTSAIDQALTLTPPASMYAIPVSVTVTGAPEDSKAFLAKLQSGDGRLVLVTKIDVGAQDGGGSSSLKPGDFQTVVTGLTYLLQDTSTTSTDSSSTDTANG